MHQTSLNEQQIWNEAENMRIERDAARADLAALRRAVTHLRDAMARLDDERIDAEAAARALTLILDDPVTTE